MNLNSKDFDMNPDFATVKSMISVKHLYLGFIQAISF